MTSLERVPNHPAFLTQAWLDARAPACSWAELSEGRRHEESSIQAEAGWTLVSPPGHAPVFRRAFPFGLCEVRHTDAWFETSLWGDNITHGAYWFWKNLDTGVESALRVAFCAVAMKLAEKWGGKPPPPR